MRLAVHVLRDYVVQQIRSVAKSLLPEVAKNICMYVCMYVCIYRERESKRERDRERESGEEDALSLQEPPRGVTAGPPHPGPG